MTTLLCTLMFKFQLENTKQKGTIWHCDNIGYVVPVNHHEFYNYEEKQKYHVVTDAQRVWFYRIYK